MNSNLSLSVRALWPALAVIATLVWASSFDESGPEGIDVKYFDKIAHFFVYGLLGTLWFRFLPGDRLAPKRWIGAFVLTLLYGVIDEWIQAGNPHRSSDFGDWVADTLGALTAIFVYRNWQLYRRVLETPIRELFRSKLSEID